jgi:hypothetical protein
MYLELVQPNQDWQHQPARKTAHPLQRYMRSARAGSLATVTLSGRSSALITPPLKPTPPRSVGNNVGVVFIHSILSFKNKGMRT